MNFKGSNWKTGTKDDLVYLEVWDGAFQNKVLDTEFGIEQARGLADNLMIAVRTLEERKKK